MQRSVGRRKIPEAERANCVGSFSLGFAGLLCRVLKHGHNVFDLLLCPCVCADRQNETSLWIGQTPGSLEDVPLQRIERA